MSQNVPNRDHPSIKVNGMFRFATPEPEIGEIGHAPRGLGGDRFNALRGQTISRKDGRANGLYRRNSATTPPPIRPTMNPSGPEMKIPNSGP